MHCPCSLRSRASPGSRVPLRKNQPALPRGICSNGEGTGGSVITATHGSARQMLSRGGPATGHRLCYTSSEPVLSSNTDCTCTPAPTGLACQCSLAWLAEAGQRRDQSFCLQHAGGARRRRPRKRCHASDAALPPTQPGLCYQRLTSSATWTRHRSLTELRTPQCLTYPFAGCVARL